MTNMVARKDGNLTKLVTAFSLFAANPNRMRSTYPKSWSLSDSSSTHFVAHPSLLISTSLEKDPVVVPLRRLCFFCFVFRALNFILTYHLKILISLVNSLRV